MINDITWREMNDETWRMLEWYPDNRVLVETEVAYRVEFASGIEDSPKYGPWLSGAQERVKRIAFCD